MDARLAIDAMLGLKPGDAHIIRNAGGLVTEDALRSLILSHYVLGTQEFMVVNHTDCGMLAVREEELRERLRRANGADSATPGSFGAFHNLEENVQGQILKIKSHPWTRHVPVRGFVYDVHSGKLKEVEAQLTRTAR
jgi:carbonic anhydrase